VTKKQELAAAYAIWNKKLEDSGFEDIENKKTALTNKSSYLKKVADAGGQLHRDSIQRFYERCNEFLHLYDAFTPFERTIWESYCDGATQEGIAKELGVSRSTTRIVIEKYTKIMTAHFSGVLNAPHVDGDDDV